MEARLKRATRGREALVSRDLGLCPRAGPRAMMWEEEAGGCLPGTCPALWPLLHVLVNLLGP